MQEEQSMAAYTPPPGAILAAELAARQEADYP